jgi:O-antigen/teichoic acid export membrane protein
MTTTAQATVPSPAPTPAGSSPEQPTLRKQVIKGSMQTVLFYGLTQAVRLGLNLALTRLLFEDVFGTMALCFVLLEGIELFSDVGIRPAVIHSKLGDNRSFLNTAWTIQVARGFAIWGIAMALGPVVAGAYAPKHEEITTLMPIVGFAAVLSGCYSTNMLTAMRAMRPAHALMVQFAGQLAMTVVMLLLAWKLRNIYALALGSLVNPLVQLLISHFLLPGERNRLHWNSEHVRSLFRYGRWVFVSTLFTFLARQTDRLVLAGYISEAMFGIYNIALVGQTMAVGLVTQVVEWIAFPAYARTLNEGRSVQRNFARLSLTMQLGAGALLAALIVAAPALIDLLYPRRYMQAGWMLRILGLLGWFSLLEACCSSLVKALATNHWMAAGHAVKFGSLLVAIPLGYQLGGVAGALIGMIVADIARYFTAALGLDRHGYKVWRRDALTTAGMVATVGAGLYLDSHLGHLGSLPRVLLTSAVTSAPWLVALALLARRLRAA